SGTQGGRGAGIRRQAGEATAAEPGRTCRDRKGEKANQSPHARIAMHIEDRGIAGRALYPDHSDEEGHQYRLADTFGTRSLQFVHAMLNDLGNATANHSLDSDFSPAPANQVAFNAALADIDGVRPKDEIEAMLPARRRPHFRI